MRTKILFAILLLSFLFPADALSFQDFELAEKYRKWIDEEVIYIATEKEKEVFFKLETDKERDMYIELFWKQRDPSPATPRNEFKDEHYRRIAYVNEEFKRFSVAEGWQTDRGRMYIILGEPIQREKHHRFEIVPMEIWYYYGNPKFDQAPIFRLLFFQRYNVGPYELYNAIADGPKSLINISGLRTPSGTRAIRDPEGQAVRTDPASRDPGAGRGLPADWLDKIQDPRDLAAYEMLRDILGFDVADATLSAFPGRSGPDYMLPSVILTKEVETYPQKMVVDDYAYEYLENKTIVEVDYSVNYINSLTQIQVLEDNPGLFFVNYSIQPNNLSVYNYQGNYNADIRISIRVQDTAGKTVVQHIRDFPVRLKKDQINSIGQRPFRLNDSFPLVPGQYKLSLLWENTGSKEFTTVEKDILVPEPEWLIMSPMILARRVSTYPEKDASIRSFQVGNLQIYPSLHRKFSQTDTLNLFFQIFGLTDELKEKGEIEYALHKEDRKIPLLSKKVSEWENDRNFFQEFALERFPPGDYKITASLLSNNEQVLSDTQEFSISEMEIPDPWIMSQPNPVRGNPIYYYIKGNQYLNKGELSKARAELEKACFIIPDSLDFALSYAKILMVSKEYRMSKGILMPFVEAKKKDFNLFYFIAKSSQEMGQLEEAIDYYHRALSQKGRIFEILNAIGDCHIELGEKDKAVEAWERSLKEKPDQEKIKTLIEKHKTKKKDSSTNFIY